MNDGKGQVCVEKASGGSRVVTQKDLARLANVSPTTVYNSLYSKNLVKKKTRRKIYELMEKYDYHPNGVARAMVRGKTDILGILMPRLDILYYARLASYIESGVSSTGLNSFFCQHLDDMLKEEREIRMMRERRVDGLVIRPSGRRTDAEAYRSLEKAGIPFVLVDRPIPGLEDYFVGYDSVAACEKLVNYLADKGHRRISIAYWPENDIEKGVKYDALVNAMLKRGIQPDPRTFIECNAEYDGPFLETVHMLENLGKDKPTAIIAFNDPAAIGVVRALNHLGIRVGKDIAVAHFGGYIEEHLMPLMTISLTCVIQPAEVLGRETARILLNQMNGKTRQSGPVLCPVEFKIGDSA